MSARPALLALVLAVLAACGGDPQPAEAPASPARKDEQSHRPPDSPALQFLPRLSEASGWTMQGDPEVVEGDRIRAYLDEASEVPATYGALDLSVGRYRSTGGRWATVTITRYPDFVKAFGAYSATIPPHAQPVGIGNRGATYNNTLTLWSGPYLASIVGGLERNAPTQATAASLPAPGGEADEPAVSDEEAARRAGFGALATTVAERMPRAESLPAVFRFLPQRALIPGSERFSAAPLFGQPALAGAFTAQYQSTTPDQKITAAIVPTPDKQTAARVLASYRTFFERNGRLLDPVPNLGEENFIGEDRLAGRSVAFRLDRFVVVFNGYGEILEIRDMSIEAAQRILNEIRQQLAALEKQEAEARGTTGTARPGTRPTQPAGPAEQPASPAQPAPVQPAPQSATPPETQPPAPTP